MRISHCNRRFFQNVENVYFSIDFFFGLDIEIKKNVLYNEKKRYGGKTYGRI